MQKPLRERPEVAVREELQSTASEVMTLQGTVNKTGILLALVVLSASYTWNIFFKAVIGSVMPLAMGGALVGFILALLTMFKRQWAGITAPLYAVAEGLFLGGFRRFLSAVSWYCDSNSWIDAWHLTSLCFCIKQEL